MDGTGKFNPRRSFHSSLQSRQSHTSAADPFGMLAMACRRFELRAALSLISKIILCSSIHHQSSPADRDYMVLPEVGLAFLRMFSSPNLDDFQREDKLSGEYW